ncbi:sensor histidine kinase [Streptacidiphilus sp. PB12-B1b]|uniref:sensor histidine kinase n=1 Tax=Streptacidiphilus sp. PB12-B1b TaxID=2705012 RepID=UPI0015FBD627|nr:sensor histidine kinase [Streptacidiphilus sp. PB12-B1b]QMU77063.1 sensor histidine kinase [Streptacidiphilus sp. PB12-B1b]
MSDTVGPAGAGTDSGDGFRHELYPYAGEAEFLSGALSFIDDARAGRELVLVAVADSKEQMLRAELEGSGAADSVSFMDTTALGRNPARLIPAWQDWIAKRATEGHQVRGISESSWADRSTAEAGELHYHEWLLNLAFARSPAWWLLCPYDTAALEPTVLEAAERCHPLLLSAGNHGPSSGFVDEPYAFAELGSPCDPLQELDFRRGELAAVRARVTACATEHGLEGARLRELLIAVTEVASNSIKYGGGRGSLRVWAEETSLVCEFRDSGHLEDPLIGRIRPTVDQIGGRGMWLVQQLCDLVQIRSTAETGTVVRLHVALG